MSIDTNYRQRLGEALSRYLYSISVDGLITLDADDPRDIDNLIEEILAVLCDEAAPSGQYPSDEPPQVERAPGGRMTIPDHEAFVEPLTVVGVPEFDDFMDHIYEHGTSSEGIIEKANALIHAMLARAKQERDGLIGAEVSVDVGTGPKGEELRYFGEVVGIGDDGAILVGNCIPNF